MNWKHWNKIKKKFPLSTLDIFWDTEITKEEADELKNDGAPFKQPEL